MKTFPLTLTLLLTTLLLANTVDAKGLSREQAAQQAQEQYGGKVLSIRVKQSKGGGEHYEIKLMKSGQVRVVRINK